MIYPTTYSPSLPVPSGRPFYLDIVMHSCRLLSSGIAAIHCFFIFAGLLKMPELIADSAGESYKKISGTWCTRITRRVVSLLVRSPLRSGTLSMVSFTDQLPVNSGCVIVTCHTPWKRLLVQWCLEYNRALVISNGVWTRRKRRIQRQAAGVADLRDIVKLLQQNSRVIIAGDVFNQLKDCPVKFFDKKLNASLFPLRLARIAKVPVIATLPALRNGVVEIDYGPRFDPFIPQLNENDIMQQFISFFENEIKKEPGIYPSLLK